MIRKAVSEDIPRIAEILIFAKRRAYRDIFKNDKVTFGEMQVYPLAREFFEKPELIKDTVVFDDEFVKGMAKIEIREKKLEIGDLKDEEAAVEIAEIYVDPFFQNLGIGGKLLRYAEDFANEKGMNNIFLWVLEKNKNARHFYEKYGFMPTGERKIEEGTPEYIVKYLKRLEVGD